MRARPDAVAILDRLEAQHPDAWTELRFRDPFELLVATILSAQCTDARVNQVTPALFARYPSARALAGAKPDELEALIKPTGFFRAKARSLIGMARAVAARHGGEVPSGMDELVELPGVGRKTANVVRGHAFDLPGLPVDRHVLRVATRLGLTDSEEPEAVEAALAALWPPERWTRASDTLILHGRRVCKPRPLCDRCQVRAQCRYFATLGATGRRAASSTRAPRPRRQSSQRSARKARPRKAKP
jgi:endonuclease-3